MSLNELKFLSKTAPYQLYRFAMDGDKQKEDPQGKEWEKREPGSLQAVLNAYAYIISIVVEGSERRINIDDICKIHELCTSGVKSKKSDFNSGKLRISQQFFGLVRTTSSDKGIKELINSHKKYPYHLSDYIESERGLDENFLALKKQITLNGIAFWGYTGGLSEEEEEERNDLYESGYIKNPRYIELAEKFQKNMHQEIENTLNTLYEELPIAHSEDEKLTAIVKAVQRLEHIHPFQDGNCRTLCMVLLNTLLMQHEFSPALISNPNKFDGFSIAELIIMLKKDMGKTQELCKSVNKETSQDTAFFEQLDSLQVPPIYQPELQDFATSLIKTLTELPIISELLLKI